MFGRACLRCVQLLSFSPRLGEMCVIFIGCLLGFPSSSRKLYKTSQLLQLSSYGAIQSHLGGQLLIACSQAIARCKPILYFASCVAIAIKWSRNPTLGELLGISTQTIGLVVAIFKATKFFGERYIALTRWWNKARLLDSVLQTLLVALEIAVVRWRCSITMTLGIC